MRKNKILYIFIKMCDCELQICCCKECESAFKNSVSASASALTNQDVLVYATASASASSEISFEDAWLKAYVEANRLAKYYAELEANTIDTTFNIIETQAISTYEINNETDITTDTLTVNGASETNGITNTGDIETNTINKVPLAKLDPELLDIIIGDFAENVTTASSNTGLGVKVFENLTTGSRNVAVGLSALRNNSIGSTNVAVGFEALLNNTTGSRNVAVGDNALASNTTGNRNVATGNDTLENNTTGTTNTAVGDIALRFNTTGAGNVAVGTQALNSNTTGNANTVIGNTALSLNTTGNRNTAIGYNADTTGQYNQSIAIGYNASIYDSNQIILGTSAETLVIQGGLNYSTAIITANITLSTPVNQFYIIRGTTGEVTLPYLSSNATNWGAVVQFKNMTGGNVNIAIEGGTSGSYSPSATQNALIAEASPSTAAGPIILASGVITQYIFGRFIDGALVECGAWYQQF